MKASSHAQKRAPPQRSPCLTGNFLSSQSVSRQVLSASECLTTVFGMGTGGTIQASSPDILLNACTFKTIQKKLHFRWSMYNRATSTSPLSTLSSSRCLTSLCYEILHLGTGFTLRCFQRLSLPDAATQLCFWRNNWYTGGPSTPVLSY